jgi:hypothetical protein
MTAVTRSIAPLPNGGAATVRAAASDAEREAAIAAWLRSPAAGTAARRAVLVEGWLFDRSGPQGVPLVGLGAGCPCCSGAAALRVTLTRTLRALRPEAVLLLVSSAEHLPRLRQLLEGGSLGVRFDMQA